MQEIVAFFRNLLAGKKHFHLEAWQRQRVKFRDLVTRGIPSLSVMTGGCSSSRLTPFSSVVLGGPALSVWQTALKRRLRACGLMGAFRAPLAHLVPDRRERFSAAALNHTVAF